MTDKSFPSSLGDISSHNKPQEETVSLETTKYENKEYTEQPTNLTPVAKHQVQDGPNMQVITIVLVLALIGIAIIKPIREFFLWFIQNVLIPTLVWCTQTSSIWLIWLAKGVINSHVELFRHLMTPRSIIFPSLDDQREETDKKINRKVE